MTKDKIHAEIKNILGRARPVVGRQVQRPIHSLYLLLFLWSILLSIGLLPKILYAGFECIPGKGHMIAVPVVIFLTTAVIHFLFTYDSLSELETHTPEPGKWIGSRLELLLRWVGIFALLVSGGKLISITPTTFLISNIVLFSIAVAWSLLARKSDDEANKPTYTRFLWSDGLALVFWVLLLLYSVESEVQELIFVIIFLFVVAYHGATVWYRLWNIRWMASLPISIVTLGLALNPSMMMNVEAAQQKKCTASAPEKKSASVPEAKPESIQSAPQAK